MKGNITFLAGKPNDTNKDYLPEAVKGSNMVVNEISNNSQVYPMSLIESHGCITDPRFTPDGKLINKGGPLDYWQSRLEYDKAPLITVRMTIPRYSLISKTGVW